MKKKELEHLKNLVENSEYFRLKDDRDYENERANARSKIVKKVLVTIYGFKNVRVKRDHGTASGWITVDIVVKTSQKDFPKEFKDSDKIHKLLKRLGITFPQYYPDAGPGDTWTDCLIINIDLQ
ncbi:MAG: hypothetical protein LiPW41_658 [Parcubacteria group bacterium LiPW_41]|nr:MAG: hypothetical protein LiPW41_658 [Parcubacteria group bacterium LiPW_41]